MNISTKAIYGVKAMVDMAKNYPDDFATVKSIAERQNIPEKYLEQIFSILKKTGLLISVRGSSGGYSLAKPPREITVGDILRVIEGELVPVDCVTENKYRVKCERTDICITRYVWARIRDGINNVVDNITLKELAEGYAGLDVRSEN